MFLATWRITCWWILFGLHFFLPPTKWHGILFQSYLSVCLHLSQTVTFKSLDVGSSYSYIWYISREYRSYSCMKVIGLKSRSYEQNRWKFLFPQKLLISNNSGLQNRAMKFACSMAFSAMADRMVWLPSLSRDQKWTCVTKCTHSQVVDLSASAVITKAYLSISLSLSICPSHSNVLSRWMEVQSCGLQH